MNSPQPGSESIASTPKGPRLTINPRPGSRGPYNQLLWSAWPVLRRVELPVRLTSQPRGSSRWLAHAHFVRPLASHTPLGRRRMERGTLTASLQSYGAVNLELGPVRRL